MHLGIKEASKGTYRVFVLSNHVYMTLNYVPILKAPWAYIYRQLSGFSTCPFLFSHSSRHWPGLDTRGQSTLLLFRQSPGWPFWMRLQGATTKSQNQLGTIYMYTSKEQPIKRTRLQFMASQLLKRKTTGPTGIICAKAHDAKPKLNIWPNCSFDLHQKCNVHQPERNSLVNTNKVIRSRALLLPHWKKRRPAW